MQVVLHLHKTMRTTTKTCVTHVSFFKVCKSVHLGMTELIVSFVKVLWW